MAVVFLLLKMAVHYKNYTQVDWKDGIYVFVSSLSTLYAIEQYGITKPKTIEVFTTQPDF
jgi:hypothetical protein